MKKTLVALAALAVVGAVSAQSSVTLYGRIDGGLAKNTTKVNGNKVADVGMQVVSAGYTGSRWGLRGSEDLGGGLKANFQLEQAFNIDNGNAADAGKQFRRQAWVGLSGGFGSMTLGRQYGMIDNLIGNYDAQEYSSWSALGYVLAANAFSTIGGGGVTCDGGAGTQGTIGAVANPGFTGNTITNNNCAGRINNSIIYTTPNMSGLTANVMWAPGENKSPVTGQGAGNYSGLFVNYAAGPLGLGMAWEKVKSTQVVAPSAISQTLWGFAGSYDLGMMKVYGLYNKGTVSTSGANDAGWGFGVVVPVSSMTLNVGYGREKTENAAGLKDKNTAFGASLHYPLSKRTRVYAEFMNGKITAGGGVNVQKDSNIGAGLIHNF